MCVIGMMLSRGMGGVRHPLAANSCGHSPALLTCDGNLCINLTPWYLFDEEAGRMACNAVLESPIWCPSPRSGGRRATRAPCVLALIVFKAATYLKNARAGGKTEAQGINLEQSLRSFLEHGFLRQGHGDGVLWHIWNQSVKRLGETHLRAAQFFLFRGSRIFKQSSKNSSLLYCLYCRPKNLLS